MKEETLFECKCCGHCCHGTATISVSAEEQQEIARFLGVDQDELTRQFLVKKGSRTEMKVVDGHCIFYGDDGLCRIHPVKPFHCKQWPLHPSILGDVNAFEAIKKDCPGFGKNASYEAICRLVKEKLD